MTTTINADTVVGGAVVTADASGVLGLQAAGNTGITLNSSRAIGVGASPSYGTSGQVLTSAGSAAAPTWTTPSAGALVFISTTTASGSAVTLDITSGFSSTYDDYLLLGENITLNASNFYRMRVYLGGTLQTSGYAYNWINVSSSVGTFRYTGDSSMDLNDTMNGSTTISSFQMYIQNVNTSTKSQISCQTTQSDGTTVSGNNQARAAGGCTNAGSLTGIRIYTQNGTSVFSTGTFRLYGISKS